MYPLKQQTQRRRPHTPPSAVFLSLPASPDLNMYMEVEMPDTSAATTPSALQTPNPSAADLALSPLFEFCALKSLPDS